MSAAPKSAEARVTEALSQTLIVDIVRGWLDGLRPQPLDRVLVREKRERTHLRRLIEAHPDRGHHEGAISGTCRRARARSASGLSVKRLPYSEQLIVIRRVARNRHHHHHHLRQHQHRRDGFR
jgi:hypothetical protein